MLLSLENSKHLRGKQHYPDAKGFLGLPQQPQGRLLLFVSTIPIPPLPSLTPYATTQATSHRFDEYLSRCFFFFYEITFICMSVFK